MSKLPDPFPEITKDPKPEGLTEARVKELLMLPDTLAKLRDGIIESYLISNSDKDCEKHGFDLGAEAMRAYMQAEMDKLEATLAHAKSRLTEIKEDDLGMLGLYENIREALASYRAWRDKQND